MLNTQTNQHIWMIELQPAHWQYPPPPSSPSTTQPTHIHTHTFSLPSLISLISLSLFCSAFFSPTSSLFLLTSWWIEVQMWEREAEGGRERDPVRTGGRGGLSLCGETKMYYVYAWVMSCIRSSHVTFINESYHIYQNVMSHIWTSVMSHNILSKWRLRGSLTRHE